MEGQQQYPQGYGYPQAQSIKETPDFMQWLFNFRDDVITPLKHSWAGEILDSDGNWSKFPNSKQTMNEVGISWGISVIQNYINPVYIISNYDEYFHNWTMRELVAKPIINRLYTSHTEFGLERIDIPIVAGEMISHINAILLGARGNGYRSFFMSTHHTDEIRTNNQQPKRAGGFGWFRKKEQPSEYSAVNYA